MAKIEYSALVNRIKGRVSHSVLSNWKGIGVIKRHNGGVHQPRSEKQQDVRGFFNDLAGEYYSLTDPQKELWQAWCTMYNLPLTALNAYVKFNQLLQKYFPGMARMVGPPPTPATPAHLAALTVSPITGTDFCVEHTAASFSTVIALVDYWPMPGLDNTVSPKWTFGASATADTGEIAVVLDYPVGTLVKFRVRTIDLLGRVSPWSHIMVTATIA